MLGGVGYGVTAIAAACKLDRGTVSDVLGGRRKATRRTREALARGLGLDAVTVDAVLVAVRAEREALDERVEHAIRAKTEDGANARAAREVPT